MHSNLVKLPDNVKKKPGLDMTEEFCNLSGLDMIELHHSRGAFPAPIPHGGFQGAEISYTGGGNGRAVYTFVPTRTIHGEDTRTTLQLEFKPEELTEHLKAWCPDTEYNRDYIAKTLYGGGQVFFVANAKTLKEIDKIAIEKGYNKKPKVRESEILENQQSTIADQQAEIEILKMRLSDSYKTPDLIADKKTKEEKMRNEAKDYVHKKEADYLAKLEAKAEAKAKKEGKDPSSIFITKEYRKTIAPKVEQVLKEMLSGKFNPEE